MHYIYIYIYIYIVVAHLRLVHLTSLICDVNRWLSGRVSALQSMVAGSIFCGRDHGIHC